MKTKYLFIGLLGLLITLSCAKKKAFNNEDGQSTVDNRDAQGENDAAVGEVNDVIGNQAKLHGRGTAVNGETSITGNACGFSVDTGSIKQGFVKLHYNGTTCNNRTRTGDILVTVQDFANGKRWKDKGCVLKIEFQSFKIVRASDKKSIELNGVQYVTNETGGSWWELIILQSQPNIVHSINSPNLLAKFDDGKTATYNIHRRVTYSYPGKIITVMAEGIGSNDGINNLENYGTTRDGEAFTSQVTTPIIWNITCGAHAPVQGELNIKVHSKQFDLKCLFAVDANGDPVTVAPNDCAYGWKIEWTYKGKTKKKVKGYN